MRGFFSVVIIGVLVFPSIAFSHPGKVDRQGGHECRKDCSEWDLYVGEYHLHEEDVRNDYQQSRAGKKVRQRKTQTPENIIPKDVAVTPEQSTSTANNPTIAVMEERKVMPTQPRPPTSGPPAETPAVVQPVEARIWSLGQLWLPAAAIALIFLLIAMIIRRKKIQG